MKIKEIINMIDEDISYQKEQLEGDFEKDKPTQWRITGMKHLKGKIIDQLVKESEETL